MEYMCSWKRAREKWVNEWMNEGDERGRGSIFTKSEPLRSKRSSDNKKETERMQCVDVVRLVDEKVHLMREHRPRKPTETSRRWVLWYTRAQ